MSDVHSRAQRHKNMSAIRSANTRPELYLRKQLFARGYRYRVAYKGLPGRPDIYFPGYRAAIFVHGCFWHRHDNCRYATVPTTNRDFWTKKFAANVLRDGRVLDELDGAGVRWAIVWECAVRCMQKNGMYRDVVLRVLEEFLLGTDTHVVIGESSFDTERELSVKNEANEKERGYAGSVES